MAVSGRDMPGHGILSLEWLIPECHYLPIWCRYNMPMSDPQFDRYFNIDTVSRILAYPNGIYDHIFLYWWVRATLGMSVVLVASHISQN